MNPSLPLPSEVVLLAVSRRRLVLGGASLAISAPLLGCGGAELFVPFFVFAFQGVVDRKIVNVSFSPDSTSSGQSNGRFDAGNCFINVRDPSDGNFFVSSNFEGSFNGRELQLMLQAAQPPLASAYTGYFSEEDTVVLTPAAGLAGASITVRRNQNNSFLPTLSGDWSGQDSGGVGWLLHLDTQPLNQDGDATVLLVGTELRGAAAAVPLLGYASIRYIELSIARASGAVLLTGRLDPDPTPPPAGTPQTTTTITWAAGGALRRVI